MMGLGLSEIAIIMVLVLLLFGPKELPQLLRQAARLFARARLYTWKIRLELEEALKESGQPSSYVPQSGNQKNELRGLYRARCDGQTSGQRREKAEAIWNHCRRLPHYTNAGAVMIYAGFGAEVETQFIIGEMLGNGKRVVLPYCKNNLNDLGLAEIADFEKDVAPGSFGIPEPVEHLRDNFFKSDLRLILCPGVAFDIYGNRLGRGKGYYDAFLREVKGRVPLVGLAFDCQIHRENLPFDYHDVPMDQVVTESGLLLKTET